MQLFWTLAPESIQHPDSRSVASIKSRYCGTRKLWWVQIPCLGSAFPQKAWCKTSNLNLICQPPGLHLVFTSRYSWSSRVVHEVFEWSILACIVHQGHFGRCFALPIVADRMSAPDEALENICSAQQSKD